MASKNGLCQAKFTKRKKKILIQLLKPEVRELIRQRKNRRLVKTCHHYFLPNDDYEAIAVVAAMRGYDITEFYQKCVEGLHYR